MYSSVSKWLVSSWGAVFFITGISKVWSAFDGSKILLMPDPITGLQFRHLMLIIGIVELILFAVCLSWKANTVTRIIIAVFTTNLLAYRLGLWWLGWHSPCDCLGNIIDALHISPQLADNIMKGVLAYLLIGSYGLLIWQWRQGRAKVEIGNQKSEI